MSEQKKTSDPYADLRGALHDVSNALTVMLGWVSEARSPDATAESVAYALRILEQRSRAARDLARRAIGAESADADQPELLDSVLRDTVDALAVEASRANVRLSLEARTRTRIHGGADLSQVVTNLVLNAIAHAPVGSEIVIGGAHGEGDAHIDIEDRGPGIPAERRDSIFDGVSTRKGGAGVGLQHARAVARSAGGEVELVPTVAGACFRVTWPSLEGAAAAPRSTARELVLQGLSVLVVEDDIDVINLLDAALGARGATLVVARTLEQMKARLAEATPHAALIDLSPISTDIAGALLLLREAAPEATVVLITGSANAEVPMSQDVELQWVRKPFEVAEIVAALTRANGDG